MLASLLLMAAGACDESVGDRSPEPPLRDGSTLQPAAAGGSAGDNGDSSGSEANFDAGSLPRAPVKADMLGPRCEHDRRGNWVCVWPIGPYGSAGPCTFGLGAVSVATHILRMDEGTMNAQITQFDDTARVRWSRSWQRVGELPALSISINALALDSAGVLHAGGEVCDRDSAGPIAQPGYYASCMNARLTLLDGEGTVLRDRIFGSEGGLERISDLAVGQAGVYIGGSYHPPWVLGGQRLGPEPAGQSEFVALLDGDGAVRWWRSFGSSEHDANDLRVAVAADGGVAVTAHPGLAASGPGFVARFDAAGAELWTRESAEVYIARIAIAADDGVYVGPGLTRIDSAGNASALPSSDAVGLRRIRSTANGGLVLGSDALDRVVEVDLEGRALRHWSIPGAQSSWYHGDLCTDGERVAISSTMEHDSDFGLLDQPLEIRERSAFLLVLKDW